MTTSKRAKRAVRTTRRAAPRSQTADTHTGNTGPSTGATGATGYTGTTVPWWPPRVGDLLRHATTHGAGPGRIRRVEAPLRVLSVFDHNGSTRVVTAEWFPTKRRWNYVVWDEGAALYGIIWPDGKPRPEGLK